MAATFPLTLSDFSDRLLLTGMTLHCPAATVEAITARGDVIRGGRGYPLWRGSISLQSVKPNCGRGIQALTDLLSGEGASFLLGPRSYSVDGLAGRTVQLLSVGSNNRDITLSGLPPGYRVARDDYLSFLASGKYAFHRSVFGAVANSAGQAVIEVWPHVLPGWVPNSVVEMSAPKFKAVLREAPAFPILFSRRQRPIIAEGASFEFIQTLR